MRRSAVVCSVVAAVLLLGSVARAAHGANNINFTAGPEQVANMWNTAEKSNIANLKMKFGYNATGTTKQLHFFRDLVAAFVDCSSNAAVLRIRPKMPDGTFGTWQFPMGDQTLWANGGCGNAMNVETAFDWVTGAEYYQYRVDNCWTGAPNCTPTKVWATGDTNVPPPVPGKPVISSSSTAPAGKVLNYDMGAALLLDAGFTVDQAKVGTAVMNGESSFRTKTISYTGCCHGLMQVNTEVHPYTITDMQDPYKNVAAALTIFTNGGSSWQPWQAYTGPDGAGSDGPWLSYKSAAVDAVDRQVACGRCALKDIANAPSSGSASVTFGWAISGTGTSLPDGYHVDRRRAGGSWSRIGEPGAAALKFTDTGATAGDAYEYRIRGWNANGSGEWSDLLVITAAASDPGGSNQLPGDYDGDGIADGPSGGGASDPDSDGSVSCGFNMFCWIKAALKWAFVPGEETKEAWNKFYATATTRPPGSWAVGGFQLITNVHNSLQGDLDSGTAGGIVADSCSGGFNGTPNAGGGAGNAAFSMPTMCVSTFVDTMADSWWAGIIRSALAIMVWGGLIFALYRRARAALGEKTEDEDTEGGLA